MASSSKRSKVSKGSSRNENFLSKDNETAYGRYSASKITPSRILIQSDIDFQILPLFSSTQLSFILTLSHSYHKEMFLQFLSNLRVTPECTRLTSFIMQQKVIIDKEDLGTFLHLRTEGDRLHTLIQEADISWSLKNDTLRGNKDKVHQPRVYTLLQNARIIQHVLRSSIIPKAGDRVNITPLLSLVTHLIITNTPFDEAQLILDYIHRLSDIRHPQTKRKKNIALGHLVCYILEKKYNLIYPEPPTEEPIFFTNASFRSLFHDPTVEGEDSEGDKEAPSEPASVPNQNAFNDIIQRFDTMETNFGQRFDQIDLHMKTQEDKHNLDMAWIRGQTDYINQNVAMINSYFTAFNPQPPPDQDPEGLQSVLAEVLCLHRGVVKKGRSEVLCLHRGVVKKGRSEVLCLHRGVVKKGRKRGSLPSPWSGEKGKKSGSLPSPWSGEKGKSCGSLPKEGRRVLCHHHVVVKKEERDYFIKKKVKFPFREIILSHGRGSCSSSCGNLQNIRYPFHLKGDPTECGGSDFELNCEGNNAVLKIHQKKFYVIDISYRDYEITLVDVGLAQGNCVNLPDRSVDPDDYVGVFWFGRDYIGQATFINCDR
ncbi:hypothetical protein M5K25_027741 [Dendrobium thyrsiflorum]|uniref:Wall-associated receptor kinase galacturonan-binding domain-containing protein n=1 Tax=Dendrobium thyrsiflorum TaxID=117978 RepID=A0ABD0TUS7_DENTH